MGGKRARCKLLYDKGLRNSKKLKPSFYKGQHIAWDTINETKEARFFNHKKNIARKETGSMII